MIAVAPRQLTWLASLMACVPSMSASMNVPWSLLEPPATQARCCPSGDTLTVLCVQSVGSAGSVAATVTAPWRSATTCTGDVAAARKYAFPLIPVSPGVVDVDGEVDVDREADGKAAPAPAAWVPRAEQAAAPIAAKATVVAADSIRGMRINSPR